MFYFFNTKILQGTRIQALMFSNVVTKFRNLFIKDKTYFVSNGIVKPVNPKYRSAHKDIELALTLLTEVKEAKSEITSQELSYNFISFIDAVTQPDENMTYGMYPYTIFHTPCIINSLNNSNFLIVHQNL